jgi:hypothetical protein
MAMIRTAKRFRELELHAAAQTTAANRLHRPSLGP